MPFAAAAAIGAVGTVAGAAIQASAANKAAKAQQAAAQSAEAEQQRQYDISREDLAPYRAVGQPSVSLLGQLMGVTGDPNSANYGQFSKVPTLNDLYNEPVYQGAYQAGLNLGTDRLNKALNIGPGLDSGAAIRALTRYGTDYASQNLNDAYTRLIGNQTTQFNRLASLAGIGQTATNTTAGLGANAANNISSLMSGAGNAAAASALTAGNIRSGAVTDLARIGGQSLYDLYRRPTPTTTPGGSAYPGMVSPSGTGYGWDY